VRTLASDIRWSLRLVSHRPAFATTVVLTLAAAIAAVTAAFGIATAVLWRPLPFAQADRLVFAWENTGAGGELQPARVTGFRFDQWRRGTRSLSSIAAFGAVGYLADMGGGAVIVHGVRVTPNYFATLGIAPALGRDFTAADADPGAANVVILSHALWKEWLGGRADAMGTSVRLGGRPFTVVGVMPAVVFPAWPENPATVTLDPESRRLWTPLTNAAAFAASTRAHVNGVVARLADGRSIDEAAAELTRMAQKSDPDAHGAVLRPFRDQFVRDATLSLLAVIGAAAAVLLVACTNLAALQGSAVEARRAELAMRAALGAGRLRIARQLATEAGVLTAAGAALGVLFARVALARVPNLLPPSVPLLHPPSLDGRTLLLAGVVSVVAALVLAAWPLARTRAVMSPAPRGTTPLARNVVFRTLVVAQVALAMALVASAALLQQSLDTVRGQNAGFAVDNVLVANVTLAGAAYNASIDRVVAAERRITDDLSRLPGVRGVAFAYDHPLEASWLDSFTMSGSAAARDDVSGSAQLRIVSPSYFETMGLEVAEGRDFAETDALGTAGVALVNAAFAQRVVDGPVLNRTLRSGSPRASSNDPRVPAEFRIVGIVENERFKGLEQPSEPAVYFSTRQFPQLQLMLLMRGHADAESLARPAREVIRRFDPGVPVAAMTTLSSILAAQLVTRRAATHAIDGFAGGALGLAALGLYGLLALLAASRTRETGIRLALGSSPLAEAGRVVRECMVNTVTGVALGLGLALIAGRFVRSLLVGVSSRDSTTLAVVSIAMLLVGLAAAALPAWRTSRIDPSTALRS
jgi:putative ABC transport system permease protein